MIVDSSNALELTTWRTEAYGTQKMYETSSKAQNPASGYCSFQSEVGQEGESRAFSLARKHRSL